MLPFTIPLGNHIADLLSVILTRQNIRFYIGRNNLAVPREQREARDRGDSMHLFQSLPVIVVRDCFPWHLPKEVFESSRVVVTRHVNNFKNLLTLVDFPVELL